MEQCESDNETLQSLALKSNHNLPYLLIYRGTLIKTKHLKIFKPHHLECENRSFFGIQMYTCKLLVKLFFFQTWRGPALTRVSSRYI
jgi:hypothetical protein